MRGPEKRESSEPAEKRFAGRLVTRTGLIGNEAELAKLSLLIGCSLRNMGQRVYATVGRASDNDVVIDHATVSNHHARLSWSGGALFVEDLSSANGTFVEGARIKAARSRPGADVRVGEIELPWSHPGLRALLKAGAGARTLVMPTHSAPTFVCGACGHIGQLGGGPIGATLTCPKCKATLKTGTKPVSPRSTWTWISTLMLSGAAAAAAYFVYSRGPADIPQLPATTDLMQPVLDRVLDVQPIGGETAKKLAAALTPMDPLTRNTAVKIAAKQQGPFHVEQVAEIWAAVRAPWRYVNDPEGREYFATASETIANGYVGDCDDFATTLASMVTAVGGKARVVLMDGPDGGHAYAEACVQGEPSKVAATLIKHYKNRFRRYIVGARPTEIAYRTSEGCPMWLNLDWSSNVPGGPYAAERWAVAIYEDGRSETLAPANPAPPAATARKSGAANAASKSTNTTITNAASTN